MIPVYSIAAVFLMAEGIQDLRRVLFHKLSAASRVTFAVESWVYIILAFCMWRAA